MASAAQSVHSARKRKTFLAALAAGESVSSAAKKATVGRRTVYDWRAADPVFADLWDDAWMQRADLLERTAFERAVIGWDEPAISAGKWVHDDAGNPVMIHKFDPRLLELLLKGAKPEVYRENIKVTGDLQHKLVPSGSSSLLLDKLVAQLGDQPEVVDAVASAFLALAGEHALPALPASSMVDSEDEGDDAW